MELSYYQQRFGGALIVFSKNLFFSETNSMVVDHYPAVVMAGGSDQTPTFITYGADLNDAYETTKYKALYDYDERDMQEIKDMIQAKYDKALSAGWTPGVRE